MFKKITALLCLTLSIVLFCMAVSATDAESTDINAIYVSGTAEESGTGVVSAPVTTLSEAFALLGDSGTIYLMDTVEVSATEGDCFIAPAHTGKITITSADGYNGALDLTDVAHFHFGGETELSNIGIVANDLVLTADNHTVTMGAGLAMSSSTDGVEYRGGHAYCDARIHLAAYAPCETANKAIESAGGELYVHSGEYWSVSTWYGDAVTVSGGKIWLYFGKRAENEEIWVRYLCPGLYSESADASLSTSKTVITVLVENGLSTPEPYYANTTRFTTGVTVNWLFRASPQGKASFLLPQGNGSATKTYYDPAFPATQDAIRLFLRSGSSITWTNYTENKTFADYCKQYGHSIQEHDNGQLICSTCNYEQCRHLSFVVEEIVTANCQVVGELQNRCTDLCGKLFGKITMTPKNPNAHGNNMIKSTYDPQRNRMGARCMGCNLLFSYIDGMPSADVYVAQNAGTPISIQNIREHFANSAEPIGTQEHPFQNFEDAVWYAMVAAKQHGAVTVHILDDAYVPSDYTMPASNGHITITGGVLHFDGEERFFKLNCDTTFEHLTFKTERIDDEHPVIISARNFDLTMGEGLVMGNNSSVVTEDGFPNCNSVKMFVIGGFIGTTGQQMNTNITVRSGDYWFVGGWNYDVLSHCSGDAKITVGKTDPDDKLQIFYLTPFSRGRGTVNDDVKATMIIDGDLSVKRFYVSTLNSASEYSTYTVDIVLQGNITGYNEESPRTPFDLRGCSKPYPITVLNVYTDSRVATAVEDSYVFFGHPNGTYTRDITLDRLEATVTAYDYTEYCANNLGHSDADGDTVCDECGCSLSE